MASALADSNSAAIRAAYGPGLDDHYAHVARTYPSFAGASVENGRLTVYVAGGPSTSAASRIAPDIRSRLATVLRMPDGFEKRAPAVQRVRYSYDQLAEWRHATRPVVFASSDVHWLDIRERENQIAVGIEPGASTAPLLRQLREVGVPRAALQFEATTPPELMSTRREISTLRSRHAPVRGGHEIAFGSSSVCTAGFSAYFGGEPAYVTASHCTNVPGAVTGTVHLQGGRRIGREVFDPHRTPALSGCPSGHTCRYSDVAIGVFDAYVDFGYATLARPAVADPLAGPIYLSPDAPTFTVRDEATYPALGEMLHKVGRTTGWTYGEVIATCLDLRVGENVTLLCQDRVAAGVNGGDSGAPVFSLGGTASDTEATLYGVLWGRAGDSFLFSSIHNIREDIRRTSGQPLRLHETVLRWPEAESPNGIDEAYTK